MRKSLIFALLTLFTLSMVMVSCDNNNDPNPPENGENRITCTCGNWYTFTRIAEGVGKRIDTKNEPDYKVYALGLGGGGSLSLMFQDDYPFVTYKESVKYEAYFFWRCECGRYHKVMKNNGTHTEIPAGQQPDEWNEFNDLWK